MTILKQDDKVRLKAVFDGRKLLRLHKLSTQFTARPRNEGDYERAKQKAFVEHSTKVIGWAQDHDRYFIVGEALELVLDAVTTGFDQWETTFATE